MTKVNIYFSPPNAIQPNLSSQAEWTSIFLLNKIRLLRFWNRILLGVGWCKEGCLDAWEAETSNLCWLGCCTRWFYSLLTCNLFSFRVADVENEQLKVWLVFCNSQTILIDLFSFSLSPSAVVYFNYIYSYHKKLDHTSFIFNLFRFIRFVYAGELILLFPFFFFVKSTNVQSRFRFESSNNFWNVVNCSWEKEMFFWNMG